MYTQLAKIHVWLNTLNIKPPSPVYMLTDAFRNSIVCDGVLNKHMFIVLRAF